MIETTEFTLWAYGGTPVRNPGPGGWAYILHDGLQTDGAFGGEQEDTTNNVMELKAVLAGLARVPEGASVTVYSDSRYVVDGASNWIVGWKRNGWRRARRRPVENAELWRQLDRLISSRPVKWQWIRQGSGGRYHDACIRKAKSIGRTDDYLEVGASAQAA